MVVTPCGLNGPNALLLVEVEQEHEKEPVPTLPLWEMEKDASIWVNQRRWRSATRICVSIVSELPLIIRVVQVVHAARALSGFSSIKQLRVFLLSKVPS